MEGKSITLSSKYGINPSVTHCECCGKEYGIAMFGTSWKDKDGKTAKAPKDVAYGYCDDCSKVINAGGVMFIEVRDGESGNNPYRTGRIIGLNKDFREKNNIKSPIAYMEQSMFSKMFGEIKFQNN